jgi:hypothetical protein
MATQLARQDAEPMKMRCLGRGATPWRGPVFTRAGMPLRLQDRMRGPGVWSGRTPFSSGAVASRLHALIDVGVVDCRGRGIARRFPLLPAPRTSTVLWRSRQTVQVLARPPGYF